MRCTVDIYVLYIFSCSYLMESIISIVDRLAGKQNVTLESLFASTWRSLKATRAKSFPAMLRSEMPR